ncbi:MAG: alpha/beta hydrolase [Candidatus Moduliflexus flocculans]|nr:alpha/beta hydrolase [Candidatus Moduliflexus flocculans]
MKNNLLPILLALCILMLSACGPKAPAFDTAKFGTAAKDVTYCTMNGLPQTMDVYYPSSGGPWPVVLYVHGGGWFQGDKAEGEGWRGLNDSGFLVVSVNYRLGDYQTKFPAMIEDVKCAVRHLRAHSIEYNLAPDNIGAIGASAGRTSGRAAWHSGRIRRLGCGRILGAIKQGSGSDRHIWNIRFHKQYPGRVEYIDFLCIWKTGQQKHPGEPCRQSNFIHHPR